MRYLNLIWKPRGFEDEKIYIQTNADKVPQRIKRKKIHIQTNALRKVPPEIRWPIFEECLHWDGTTPALLVALRGDQKLYSEALAIFYKMNIFRVTPRNYNKLWQHKLSSNQSITRMTVE
jgi:hypothetical protein